MAKAPDNPLRIPAELSLGFVTISIVLTFGRLFTDVEYLGPLLVAAIASHAVVAFARHRLLSLPLSAALSALAFVVVSTWVFYFWTTRFGLPTSLTLTELRADMVDAMDTFQRDRAPVEPLRGFLFASAVGIWLAAFLSDWSAFRLWSPFEAVLPAGGLFVFASILGADKFRLRYTAIFLIAILAFLLLHRVARHASSAGWVHGRSVSGSTALLRFGAILGFLAVLAGLAFGPRVPGAEAEGLVDWRDGPGGSGTRITVSPLVEVQGRLVEQRNIVAFVVQADQRQYWRLTSLDKFDGVSFSSNRAYERTSGRLASTDEDTTTSSTQNFFIQGLSSVWLPAAYEPQTISIGGVRWDDDSSSLIIDGADSSDGLLYQVTSAVPEVDKTVLRASSGAPPQEISDTYLDLPDNFSPTIRDLALQITANQPSNYDKVVALQDYFQGNYTYSLDVGGGHDQDRLENFVFNEQAGYCEQFAVSFAAMARSLGIPSRVAIGFTPGDQDPDDLRRFIVRGRHAHAWPEVYLTGIGWLPFEPTPSRGIPGAESYTGVPESQDSTPIEELENAADSAGGDGFDDFDVPEIPIEDAGSSDFALEENFDQPGRQFGLPEKIILGLLAAMAGYTVLMYLLKRLSSGKRQRQATKPSQRVDASWHQTLERLETVGVGARSAETPIEFAQRASGPARIDRDGYVELARLTTDARFAPDGLGDAEVARAGQLALAVDERVKEQTTLGQQTKTLLDPRPLLPDVAVPTMKVPRRPKK